MGREIPDPARVDGQLLQGREGDQGHGPSPSRREAQLMVQGPSSRHRFSLLEPPYDVLP
jgi:hypothetical protein